MAITDAWLVEHDKENKTKIMPGAKRGFDL